MAEGPAIAPSRVSALEHAQLLRVLPLVLLLYAALLPQEVRLDIGPLSLYAYRLTLLALAPVALMRMLRSNMRWNLIDGLYVAAAGWIVVALAYNHGSSAIERAGALLIDILLPYFVARVSIRSIGDIRYSLVLYAPGIGFVGALIALESVTRTPIVRPLAESIFSPLPKYVFGAGGETLNTYEIRLGLLRAQGPFTHQILAGLFLTSLLPLYAFLTVPKWARWVGILGCLGAFFTVSSASFIGLAIVAAVAVYDLVQRQVEIFTWPRLCGLIAVALLSLQLLTKGGVVNLIIRSVALNQQTGFYRKLIWDYGVASVGKHPVFGIGNGEFEAAAWMTTSVDNEWLLGAIRYGLPYEILILGAFVACMVRAVSFARHTAKMSGSREGLAFTTSLSIILIVGTTVAFFSGVAILVPALLGLVASLSVIYGRKGERVEDAKAMTPL